MNTKRRLFIVSPILAALLFIAVLSFSPSTSIRAQALAGSLIVSGNHLVNTATGATVVPRGVNRSGTEYACIQGWGIFDGPSDAASIAAIAAWGATIVRIPLNEDCWLGINGVAPAYGGATYRNAIVAYVNALHSAGLYAELSLIWGAPGSYQATYQSGAPDEDHSPAMWASLAATFAGDHQVILAPWGETIVDWNCFRDGGVCEATYGPVNTPYNTAGMQQAVTVMRGAGYHGPIAIPCIDYANDCVDNPPYFGGQTDGNGGSGGTWLNHAPTDTLTPAQLVGEMHVYGKNVCSSVACLDATVGTQTSVPFLFGETGETYDGSDCNNTSTHISTFMNWADSHTPQVGYEAWTWDTWGACNESLITNYGGTPYGVYGSFVRAHLLSFGMPPTPTATSPATASPSPSNTPTPTATIPSSSPTATATPSPSPSPSPPMPKPVQVISGVPCVVTIAGVQQSGTCTGAFQS